MTLSKRYFAILGILLGITGIVSCHDKNTLSSEPPIVEKTGADSCIIPEVAGYDNQESSTTKHPGNIQTEQAAADCMAPSIQGYDK